MTSWLSMPTRLQRLPTSLANTTFTALGSQQQQLAQGIRQLPVTLRQGNKTFAELPSTFAALTRLVEASKPTSKPLVTLFSKLRPLVTTATPAVGNFNLAINRAGQGKTIRRDDN